MTSLFQVLHTEVGYTIVTNVKDELDKVWTTRRQDIPRLLSEWLDDRDEDETVSDGGN